jgi:telomeric repeat-binding factor 2-interacting protein 1
VLDALVAGESIPTDMRGVWTAAEDLAMAQGAARDLARLLKKHGRGSSEARKEFLQLFDEEDKDVDEVEFTGVIEEK